VRPPPPSSQFIAVLCLLMFFFGFVFAGALVRSPPNLPHDHTYPQLLGGFVRCLLLLCPRVRFDAMYTYPTPTPSPNLLFAGGQVCACPAAGAWRSPSSGRGRPHCQAGRAGCGKRRPGDDVRSRTVPPGHPDAALPPGCCLAARMLALPPGCCLATRMLPCRPDAALPPGCCLAARMRGISIFTRASHARLETPAHIKATHAHRAPRTIIHSLHTYIHIPKHIYPHTPQVT